MPDLSVISVQFIKGVGPGRKKLFANLGVETVEDLLYLFPRRYEDRRQMTPLAQVEVGETQTVTGKVVARGSRRSWYTRKHVNETVIDDKSGRLYGVWFNQPYLERYFRPGTTVVWHGKVGMYKNRLQMVSPEYEIIGKEDQGLSMSRIVPIYPLTKGMSQRYLRKVIRACLDKYSDGLTDILPVWLRNKHRLANIYRCIGNLHFPEDFEQQEEAHRRVSFEEFFLFQLSVCKRRMSILQKKGIAHAIDFDLIQRFEAAFPFELTGAQKRVIREIARDMQSLSPMLRLLQGDVGSGKTVPALFGCAAAAANGRQAAIMAPTEILARQHYENIKKLFKVTSHKSQVTSGFDLKVVLLLGSMGKKKKDEIQSRIRKGEVNLVIGTHAILNEDVEFKDLSFVVIDEQHKFGVRQRALLSKKGGNPDVLVMTATPIPRTLSLTLFGDLDISSLGEIPPGRGKVTTEYFPPDQEEMVYQKTRDAVTQGRQAYIIYPLINESDKLDLKAADTMFKRFEKREFKDTRMGLIHGQTKKQEAEEIMRRFKDGRIDVLVSTTVLEVGIDVPNASVMVIEHAERFGLAQLHQLRGRIGRGEHDGQCLLIAETGTDEAQERMKAICSTTDGFKIAEADLLIRGPGHYFGRHQHGLNELRYANPMTEIDILKAARQEAQEVIHQDADLVSERNHGLKEIIQKRYPDYLKMVEAG